MPHSSCFCFHSRFPRLHLTLTSEWNEYRWGPVSGGSRVPGLVDSTGNLWPSVPQVAPHATPDEVTAEITAQLNRARAMGFQPTHLDTHMGTVYATTEFMKKYMELGIENDIPVMLPGGADQLIQQQTGLRPGVTMMIMHCSDSGAHFAHISDSGPLRRGDMLAMLDPARPALRQPGLPP